MDIVVLKTFLEVASTQHFGHAAENLCVSQSTVSARIRALEEELGVELFVRQRSNIHLTSSGQALIAHAKSILTLWGRARQELGTPAGMKNSLVVGGLSGLWDITLQDWLATITNANPELALNADIFGARTLVQRILNRTMDVAFLYDAPQGSNLISQPLTTIQLRMVSSTPVDNVQQALDLGYISVYWGMNFAVEFAASFPDLAPAKILTGLGRIAYEYLRKNIGSAYLAESAVQRAVDAGELFYVPNAPVFERKAYAIFHHENERSEFIRKLIEPL